MSESQRFDYPLGPGSLVLDVGAFVGTFARDCLQRWGCRVISFEPLHVDALLSAARGAWSVEPYGLGARTERVEMSVRNDSSSVFVDAEHPVAEVQMVDVCEAWENLELGIVDLMKINIEGGEYALLERMISSGLVDYVRYLQVQFHPCLPDARTRRAIIRAQLTDTHREQWCVDWVWESWEHK